MIFNSIFTKLSKLKKVVTSYIAYETLVSSFVFNLTSSIFLKQTLVLLLLLSLFI